jgi:hypothetical protein
MIKLPYLTSVNVYCRDAATHFASPRLKSKCTPPGTGNLTVIILTFDIAF